METYRRLGSRERFRMIEQYHSAEDRYPSTLQDLVPRQLDTTPDTGMVGFPSFEYVAPLTTTDGVPEQRPFSTYEPRSPRVPAGGGTSARQPQAGSPSKKRSVASTRATSS